MLDVLPSPSGCPMTTIRKGRRYLATVGRGKAISLHGDKSAVRLEIKEACPKRAYLMEIRTDLAHFKSLIPYHECFISPIVKVLAPAKTKTSAYILKIPHCLNEDDDKRKLKVRIVHENRTPAVVLVPSREECADGVLFYDIDDRFIELHTQHFTTIACTICQTPFHCLETISSVLFAKFTTQTRNIAVEGKNSDAPKIQVHRRHDVQIRPYFCGIIQGLVDFREVITHY